MWWFSTLEYTKSFTAVNTESDHLTDKYRVKVVYKGKPKEWKNLFRLRHKAKVDPVEVSSITKNLGVLNSLGGVEKKPDELKVIRAYIIEALQKAGLVRSATIPDFSESGKYNVTIQKGARKIGWYVEGYVIVINLAKWKIGFNPCKDNKDKFEIIANFCKEGEDNT